jgi:hypothetical protein
VEFLKQQAAFDAETRKVYPELFKGSSEESKMVESFLAQNPGMLNLPNARLILGDAIRGMRERLGKAESGKRKAESQKQEAKRETVPVKKVVARAVRPVNAAPPTKAKRAVASAAESRFLDSGRGEDLAAMIEATL